MKRLFEAFAYPFAYGNAFILILGVAVMSVLSWLTAGYLLQIAFLGYYALYLREILSASMEGKKELPYWPDWSDYQDFIQDLLSIVVPFAVSFGPLLLFRWLYEGADSTGPGAAVLSILLFLLGWLYLPMAILVWTFHGAWNVLNPVAVAISAWRTGPTYLGMSALMAVLVSAGGAVRLIPAGMLTTFGASMLTFTALVISMRMLGTFYRMNREILGWDRSARPEPV